MTRLTRIAYVVLGLSLVTANLAHAQRRPLSGYSLYARALLSENRKPSIKVSAHVPYSNLVFLREGDGFKAEYKLYIRIFDRSGKKMLDSAVRTKRETVAAYEETKSHKNASSLSHTIEIGPGEYVVRCTVRVSETQLAYSDETAVVVPDIMQSGVGLSKPGLFAVPVDTSRSAETLYRVADDELAPVERTDKPTFVALDQQPALQFDVYLEKAARDSTRCDVTYEVITGGEQVLYGKRKTWLSGNEDRFVVSFNVDDWEPGEYTFNVKATVFSPTRSSVANLSFDLEFTRAMLTRRWDDTVAMLSIIATQAEVRELEEAAPKKRSEAWAAFWVRRDPTPGTRQNEALDEHWRRVRHANSEFATSEPGWKTDRGRVYIRYGKPDETEIRTEPYVQGQYLVWRYYKNNLTFVFHDRYGLGEYVLTNSSNF